MPTILSGVINKELNTNIVEVGQITTLFALVAI